MTMKAIKAVYDKGQVSLAEPVEQSGPVEVLVVFPDGEPDPWEKILKDTRRRPALDKMIEEVEAEIAAGKTMPLDLNQL
jgi:hypothetical protein